jgi:sec-independent protein translocase protein TatC
MCFAFFIICPLSIGFFTQSVPSKVTVMADMSDYLDFMITMLFASGAAFEIPIITVILIKFKIVTKQQLTKYRPYVIVGAFVLGMLLTPPDVISQILLAIPMLILFELGIIMGSWPAH